MNTDRKAVEYGKIATNNFMAAIKAQGLDQNALANTIGHSKAFVSNTLANLREGKATLVTIVAFAEALGLTLSDIFCEMEEGLLMPQPIVNSLKNLSPGDVFELPDLAPHYWVNLTDGERRQLGKIFYEQVISGKHPGIKFRRKKPNAEYMKL